MGRWLTLAALCAAVACTEDVEPPPPDDPTPTETVPEPPIDADQDGIPADEDCDDANPDIFPGAPEICDGIDNDCDEQIDDADADLDLTTASAWHADADADGFGAGPETRACVAPEGFVADATDCDDGDDTIRPDAIEVCDAIDNDCDTLVDDADDDLDLASAGDWYADGDTDGFGAGAPTRACEAPEGFVADATDCDDGDDAIRPDAVEVCDSVDNDCDTLVDDDDPDRDPTTGIEAFADADSDGFGDPSTGQRACTVPADAVTNGDDCNDGDDAIRPDAVEVCDSVDNDCDALVDDDDPDRDPTTGTEYFADADSDGFGDPSTGQRACTVPADAVTNPDDCDDGAATVSPSAPEICDTIDNDCDTLVDDDDDDVDATQGGVTTWLDVDLDGFGDPASALTTCTAPPDRITVAGDCDDQRDDVFPGATEYCDGVLNDCDAPVFDESGLATVTDPAGVRTNVTAQYTGTPQQEARIVLDASGEVALCEGTWYTSFAILDGPTVTVRGYGSSRDAVRIEGITRAPFFVADEDADVTIEGVTAANADDSAYGIRCFSTGLPHRLHLRDVRVTDNQLNGDAALSTDGCDVTIDDVEVDGNGIVSNAVYVVNGSLVATALDIHDNVSDATGGGLFLGAGTHDVSASRIVANRVVKPNPFVTPGGGGLVVNTGAIATVSGTVIANNVAPGNGGGVVVVGDLTLNDAQVDDNVTTASGGGVYVNGGTLSASRTEFRRNEAVDVSGGGIVASTNAQVSLTSVRLLGNTAGNQGGAIWASTVGTRVDVVSSDFGAAGTSDDNLPSDVNWDSSLALGAGETFCFGPLCP